jgi:hypothetical protein
MILPRIFIAMILIERIVINMRDDESTKAYVNRLRAIVSRMPTLPAEWKMKHFLSALRMSHISPKLRELLAEKAPETVQEAQKIVEAFKVCVKDKPVVDCLMSALSGSSASASIPVDQVPCVWNGRRIGRCQTPKSLARSVFSFARF